MKRKALENQLELQELALKRELAEKKAIAEECQRLVNRQDPFSVMDDLSCGTIMVACNLNVILCLFIDNHCV